MNSIFLWFVCIIYDVCGREVSMVKCSTYNEVTCGVIRFHYNSFHHHIFTLSFCPLFPPMSFAAGPAVRHHLLPSIKVPLFPPPSLRRYLRKPPLDCANLPLQSSRTRSHTVHAFELTVHSNPLGRRTLLNQHAASTRSSFRPGDFFYSLSNSTVGYLI